MAKSNNTLCLDKFYPEKDLMITDIDQQRDKIIIQMKSTSSSCKCPVTRRRWSAGRSFCAFKTHLRVGRH